MQVVSEQRAAQRLSRNRQRIASRIRSLKMKRPSLNGFPLTAIVFPQFERHFKGKHIKIRECTCSYERPLFTIALPEEILLYI